MSSPDRELSPLSLSQFWGALHNSIAQMFDFTRRRENGILFLNPGTGQPEGDR
jgi:hypothetical protein